MAKVAWPTQEAQKILKSAKDPSQPIVFETGYGPSGLPHIGTFGEVVRTLFVMNAVKELAPDREVQLKVFSDDMDGLRSLPENVPNHDLLRPHLGAPLSSIPDPFQKKESYAAYMNSQLCLFLDSFGFQYEFCSSTKHYKGGAFDRGLESIMDHYDAVRETFIKTISEEKREAWSPFFPICESCGKIYSTRVTNIDRERYELTYRCDQDGKLFKACGHEATTTIKGGAVKVGWKVDWALRWYTFGVNYEMYGKDLMESATISGKICRILGGAAPVPYKYELFLDENGAKISKKIGNGISMDQWMAYAPFGALLNFLLGNPNKAKKMGLPILPRLVDEYLQLATKEPSNEVESSMWYLARVQNRALSDQPELQSELSFSLLYNVAESLSIEDPALLYEYALKYDARVGQNESFFQELCGKVIALYQEYQKNQLKQDITVDATLLPFLLAVRERLDSLESEEIDGDEFQRFLFSIAKENELNQRAWFGFLYAVLLGKDQGPKIGPFFGILGREKSLELVVKAVERYQ